MSLLNFPDNPTIGDEYTGPNGVTYKWDGNKWIGHTAAASVTNTSSYIINDGYVVQVNGEGNLVLPVGASIIDTDGNPIASGGGGGTVGSTGATGATGDQGATGIQGNNGATGSSGVQGATGATGAQGNVGATGSQGASGVNGSNGATGGQGATGSQGASGAGFGGLVSYTTATVGLSTITFTTNQIAVSQSGFMGGQYAFAYAGTYGNVLAGMYGYIRSYGGTTLIFEPISITSGSGSYSQWLFELTGKQGEIGATGPQGIPGTATAQGATGATGPAGSEAYTPTNVPDWRGSPTVATFSSGLDELAGRTHTLEGNKDRITTGSYSVVLGSDGNLVMPVGASIIDADGNPISTGGGLSITDFGIGFVNNLDNGKITTSKLYNENPNPGLNNQYTLEVTNGGVVVLPDQSIINGATLKTVPGNYAGITAGPASPAGKDEDSWVWVDNDGATIATKYSTDAHTWTFNNDGELTFPSGNMTMGNLDGSEGIRGNTNTQIGILSQGTGGSATLQWVDDVEDATAVAAVVVNSLFDANTGSVQIITGNVGPTPEHSWTFDNNGMLTAPGHIVPDTNLAYDLGSTTTQWRSIYVGTGTIYIGGVALGVDQNNYVTVDGNPLITINTAGNLSIQGDVNIGTVTISDTAPTANTGTQWYNTLDGRIYIAHSGQWLDASPVVVPSPGTYLDEITIDGSTLNINGSTLTISNTGTLLVNGSEVTGSGTGSSTHIEYTDGQSQYTSTVDLGYNFEVDTQYAHLNINGNGDWEIGSNNFDTKIFSTDDPGNEPRVIVVRADNDDWTFGPLGRFTLPDGAEISSGMGAIRLTPSGASSSTQSLVIYPTAGDGNHIHLTAGGGETDLYLGSDIQYVKVDHGGSIVIGAVGANTSTWTFGTDGVLTLSTASTILGNSSDPNVYIETATTSTTSTWTFGTDGVLTLPAATPVIKGGGTGTDVTVVAGTGTNNKIWTFSGDGGLTFPDTTSQTTAWRGLSNAGDQTLGGRLYLNGKKVADGPYEANSIEMGASLGLSAVRGIGGPSGGIVLQTAAGYTVEHIWQFGYDGKLTLPDGGTLRMSPAPISSTGTVGDIAER